MQEKKNKRLLISLIALVILTAGAYWMTNVASGPVVDTDLFRGYDLKTVDNIRIRSANDTISLQYSGSSWKVNGQFPAESNQVEVLFATLLQAEPKRPVAASQSDSIRKVLESSGRQVTISSQGQTVEEFYVGGNPQKTQAYFLKAGGTQPYVMAIPGYRVYVGGIFELGENDWRDKYVFGFNWRNFESLEAGFPKADNGFIIRLDNTVAEVVGVEHPDTARLNNYLDDVSLLRVQEYVSAPATADSLKTQAPQLSIVVKDIGKKEYRLKLFSFKGNWLGFIGDSQWAIFSEKRIRNILHPRSYFIGKPSD